MPEYALWSLIISLIALFFGVAIKAIEYRSLLNKANEEVTNLRAEVTVLKANYEQSVAHMAELNNKWTPNIL